MQLFLKVLRYAGRTVFVTGLLAFTLSVHECRDKKSQIARIGLGLSFYGMEPIHRDKNQL